MHILISAFTCQPFRGSEPGVGWEWAKALSEISDHDITVLTHAMNREPIERYRSIHPDFRVRFRYVDLANRLRRFGSPGHYVFYYLWQIRILFHLLASGQWRQYDLVHHLTYGGIRSGSLLFLIPRPFLVGPLGGGEVAPPALAQGLGEGRVRTEWVRVIGAMLGRIEPVLTLMQLRAVRMLAKTPATAKCLIWRRSRVHVAIEIGAPREPVPPPPRAPGAPFRILFAARMLYWKGCDFLVDAMKLIDDDVTEMELVIVGEGERTAPISEKIRALRHVRAIMTGRLPQQQLFDHYQAADLFVFPSLHDSSGNVVLEAMTFGLPVLCFDLGGPPLIAGDAAMAVNVDDANYDEACRRLAAAIRALRDDPERRAALSRAAVERARKLSWHEAVRSGYGPLLNPARATQAPPLRRP